MRFNGHRFLRIVSASRVRMASLDTSGCLVNSIEPILVTSLMMTITTKSLRAFVFPGRPDTPRW